jgi:hypothetical protein
MDNLVCRPGFKVLTLFRSKRIATNRIVDNSVSKSSLKIMIAKNTYILKASSQEAGKDLRVT